MYNIVLAYFEANDLPKALAWLASLLQRCIVVGNLIDQGQQRQQRPQQQVQALFASNKTRTTAQSDNMASDTMIYLESPPLSQDLDVMGHHVSSSSTTIAAAAAAAGTTSIVTSTADTPNALPSELIANHTCIDMASQVALVVARSRTLVQYILKRPRIGYATPQHERLHSKYQTLIDNIMVLALHMSITIDQPVAAKALDTCYSALCMSMQTLHIR
jgi:hypothetical protein